MTPTTSEREKLRAINRITFALVNLGMSIKETAAACGVSDKYVAKVIREQGLRAHMKRKKKELKEKPFKFDESLSAFTLYVKRKDKKLHEAMAPLYEQFLKTV